MSFEKIIWISSANMENGATNNFYYLLNNSNIDYDATNITVQLIQAYISTSLSTRYFQKEYIKIMIDFNTFHNQSNKQYNNYIVAGVISPMMYRNYYSDQLEYPGPIYKLSGVPNSYINILLHDHTNAVLLDDAGQVPNRVLLCLKFTYDK